MQFEQVLVPSTHSVEFLKINPNGKIPVIDDDGLVLFESLAINLYLAEKYGKAPFWLSTTEDHGRCYQWSFWAANELEPHIMAVMWNTALLPELQRDVALAAASRQALLAPLTVLDGHLLKRKVPPWAGLYDCGSKRR